MGVLNFQQNNYIYLMGGFKSKSKQFDYNVIAKGTSQIKSVYKKMDRVSTFLESSSIHGFFHIATNRKYARGDKRGHHSHWR